MFAETRVFGLTVAEIAVVVAAIGYVVSLLKNWRPIRTFRIENIELRAALESVQKRLDAAVEQIASQKDEIERLKKATDLSILQTENAQILSTLDKIARELSDHDDILSENTAAIVDLTSKINGKVLVDKKDTTQ